MSNTRGLVLELKRRLGAVDPVGPVAPPLVPVAAPPSRVFPKTHEPNPHSKDAAAHTTALLGIGAVGTRYATDVVLQFQAELAVAHGAVAAELPDTWANENGLLSLRSRVTDHREFLLRPDLGRRLSGESLAALSAAKQNVDVQPILADGLSAPACMGAGIPLLQALTKECDLRGMSVGTPMCAKFARVWLQDEIGEAVRAKVAVILLGERPGLGTGDGLSAYIVYAPKVGKVDSDRNMMSNIHARGTPPPLAAKRLAVLISAMRAQKTSGVALDLSKLAGELGDAAGRAHRAPQVRQPLVEVG